MPGICTPGVAAILKLNGLTPVTLSLKVTVKATLDAEVGLVPARTIETTDGRTLLVRENG